MATGQAGQAGTTWLVYALMTVVFWGLYGILLHTGRTEMQDQANGLYKAFLFVGVAYFLTAVLAPLAMLKMRGATWQMPPSGMIWSLVAGVAGAAGAFCVLLAFGAKGSPAVVMSIVFGGAPVINSVVAVALHPPEGGLAGMKWQFVAGIVLAAVGGCLVTLYRPTPAPAHKAAAPSMQSVASHPGRPDVGRAKPR